MSKLLKITPITQDGRELPPRLVNESQILGIDMDVRQGVRTKSIVKLMDGTKYFILESLDEMMGTLT